METTFLLFVWGLFSSVGKLDKSAFHSVAVKTCTIDNNVTAFDGSFHELPYACPQVMVRGQNFTVAVTSLNEKKRQVTAAIDEREFTISGCGRLSVDNYTLPRTHHKGDRFDFDHFDGVKLTIHKYNLTVTWMWNGTVKIELQSAMLISGACNLDQSSDTLDSRWAALDSECMRNLADDCVERERGETICRNIWHSKYYNVYFKRQDYKDKYIKACLKEFCAAPSLNCTYPTIYCAVWGENCEYPLLL